MRILPHILTGAPVIPSAVLALDPTPVSPEIDHELRLLKERVQALESQPTLAPVSEVPDFTPQISQLKSDLETQAQTMASMQRTFETIESRLHSCEEAPRLFALTFMKEVEERVQAELATLEKKMAERFDKLPVAAPVPPSPTEKKAPEPVPVAAAIKVSPPMAVAPTPVIPTRPNWEARFESHEKVLAELMKEISAASKQAAPQAAKAPVMPEPALPADTPKPFQTSAPDQKAEHSLNIAWTPADDPAPAPRSLATRLWYYLNAPAFGSPSHHHPTEDSHPK